ncbi:hypothetical protein [Adhaeretor mobilis]|uniref:hypothetical protein n=1 Tax=Adhaeretor mobilis TaxID=1930276 RepID=UPI0011A47AAD|nr:hypothetical protein [Adhaeretor mobilis]
MSIVTSKILSQHSLEMRFAEHDHMIETFPPHRANQPLDLGILPGRAKRRADFLDFHACNPANWPLRNPTTTILTLTLDCHVGVHPGCQVAA